MPSSRGRFSSPMGRTQSPRGRVPRRKDPPKDRTKQVQLERVLGLTVTNNTSLAVDPNTGTVAYPAGCVVVLYNPRKNRQSHIFNTSRKTITCVAFSADGKLLVTGECGHQPAVRVWDLEDKAQVSECHGHKFGINCVAFHPIYKYIISIGSQHDMGVNVWNWKTSAKLASNKVATKVTDMAFSDDGSTFVTVGNRHVKFWYLNSSKSRVKETVPLLGRSGILGDQKNNFFCSVSFGHGDCAAKAFCITESGLLCEFNEKRLLDKWVELRTSSANSVRVGEDHIFIGCADGVVRVFSARSLHFVSTLPRPHYLGVDVSMGTDPSHIMAPANNAKYPDVIAVALDNEAKKVTCVYNDHSMYVWDVHDVKKVGKSRSFLYHSACIWGLEVYPKLDDSSQHTLPPGSFITCSSDDTIRFWNLEQHMNNDTNFKRNIYSNELLKTIYTDPDLNNLLDIDFNPAGKTDKTDEKCLEKNGVRSIRVSPDGQTLASGDRMGNIRIHDLQYMEEVSMLEAHDSEVLCLEYTKPETGYRLLTSASRDRLIHVFDIDQNYSLLQTLDDHSSAITSVKFVDNESGPLKMLSCGADKSILFRTAQQDPDLQFVLNRHLVGKTTLYDMDVDPTRKFVATACQDRNVRIYNIKNGKKKKVPTATLR